MLTYGWIFADDPYYCGLRARVPNFTKSKDKANIAAQMARYPMMPAPLPPHHAPQLMWHARSYDSGMGMSLPLSLQSLYNGIVYLHSTPSLDVSNYSPLHVTNISGR